MEVVLLGAPLVGMPLDGHLLEIAGLDAVREVVELRPRRVRQGALVEGEPDGSPVALVARGTLGAHPRLAGLAGATVVVGGAGVRHALVVLARVDRYAVRVGGTELGE